jgi:hypothetical protein
MALTSSSLAISASDTVPLFVDERDDELVMGRVPSTLSRSALAVIFPSEVIGLLDGAIPHETVGKPAD